MDLRTSLFLLALYGSGMVSAGQTPSGMSNTQGQNPTRPANASPPSSTLQPSLDVLKQAISEIRVDRWKASGAIRTEAQSNVGSIQRDLESTLPPLLGAADAAPESTAKVLPVYRNVDALYDVMLRLVAAGRLAAPSDQMSALDQALARLSDGRRSLGEQLQADADGQDRRVSRLEAALKAVPPPTPPVAPVVCPPTSTKKKARPVAKSKAPASTSQDSSTPH
jgi:hypothetical protein